jgi:[ribosomal protein S5]-alanine N-acetyltransferase
MHLPTERPKCTLRPWQPEDKPALAHHANNRKIWRNLTDMFPHPYTEADAASWIAFANQSSPSICLAIALDNLPIGGIGIIAGEGIERHTGQFGYWLGEDHWGKGFATAAARAMVAHAFASTSFIRLEAKVFAWNPPSMHVLEKVGFVREGILRQSVFKDEQMVDGVMYAIVRDDYSFDRP